MDREYDKMRPMPMDNTKADYLPSPTEGNDGYNMDFEPYASRYDNKLMVDVEGNNDVIGVLQRPRGDPG